MIYLKEVKVPIPFDHGKIVIRREKTVELELERVYSSETKNSRVTRKTIGQVVPLYSDLMYPNENYFALIPNTVPEEIRDAFLRKCARQREKTELRKNPEAMMRRVAQEIESMKEKGAEYAVESRRENTEKAWYIKDEHDLEYGRSVFSGLFDLSEKYAARNPNDVLNPYKVRMYNRLLSELKLTLPGSEPLQSLEMIPEPEEETDSDGNRKWIGLTNSDVMMLLIWYKNALEG